MWFTENAEKSEYLKSVITELIVRITKKRNAILEKKLCVFRHFIKLKEIKLW